jgi:hypothetical protein
MAQHPDIRFRRKTGTLFTAISPNSEAEIHHPIENPAAQDSSSPEDGARFEGAVAPFMSPRGVADSNHARSRLQRTWQNAPSHPSDKHQGRRTMGRHGNRP